MLGRIHQSGFLTRLSTQSLAQIHNGIAVYKQHIRKFVPVFVPYYPLGMPDITRASLPAALGMRAQDRHFIAVWRREGNAQIHVPGRFSNAQLLYPCDLGIELNATSEGVTVGFPNQNMACIFSAG